MAATTRGLTRLVAPICGPMVSVTPYSLCDHRCTYCCTEVQGASRPIVDAAGARQQIRDAVAASDVDLMCILGAFADAYPNAEAEHAVTRAVLDELVLLEQRIVIVTKGDVILRDLDLLRAGGDKVRVTISLASLDDDVLARMDVGAPSGTARLAVLDALLDAGIDVDVNALPWLPGVTDAAALLERIPAPTPITFSPLSFLQGTDRRRVLGRTFTRDEVWAAYLDEHARFGNVERTSWVRPSLTHTENDPMHRLAPPSSQPVEIGARA